MDPRSAINGKIRIKRKPALFQHKGKHSSLPGKMQTLTDHAFSLKSAIQLQKTGTPGQFQKNLWLKLSYTKGVKIKGVEVLYSIKVPNSTVNLCQLEHT
uniref:Uncharacterized protein n=1 Tax=Ditylenchus dipsaci TaxID=166011 RepID=A0A915CP89_9BILA